MSNQDSISLGFRPDIQGLRALAVLMVLVFHVFPSAYPGGYIGVDIFFVISGYLISSGLLKQQASEQGISLLGFYERRIRRLMPAATLVLVFGGGYGYFNYNLNSFF
ncbi:MAG: acyltransferase, partial [Henriciella sp.]|nr:acyltransferase [Henriciella sp.]